jgi:hypothetical protein
MANPLISSRDSVFSQNKTFHLGKRSLTLYHLWKLDNLTSIGTYSAHPNLTDAGVPRSLRWVLMRQTCAKQRLGLVN